MTYGIPGLGVAMSMGKAWWGNSGSRAGGVCMWSHTGGVKHCCEVWVRSEHLNE